MTLDSRSTVDELIADGILSHAKFFLPRRGFYLLFFLGDSAKAMVTTMITTRKNPNQSEKVLRRKSRMSKERVPSNNSANRARVNNRTPFFNIDS